jgi:rod shape-determining protein MreD
MLIFAFLLATLALILQGILLPKLTILAFAPLIAFVILRSKLIPALFTSLLAGAIVDLFSDDPMGIHALNYVLVTAILSRFRTHLSHDEPLHLTLFSGGVSILSTLIQLFLLFLFDKKVPFDSKWTLLDLTLMPLIDAFYAFVWFAAPLHFIAVAKKFISILKLKKKTS